MIIQDQEPIRKNLREFYSSLYTRKSLKTERDCLEYLAGISAPSLSKHDQGLCEGQLSLKEIFDALNNMPTDKTPGNDGITKEFYLAFFDILEPEPFLMGYNHVFSQGELSASQKQAVIALIEKKDRDKQYIKNWRPISLLNVDAKIISKILATRLKKVISQLISSDQTAYVSGRFIGESVRLTSDVLEYMKISELPGYLITIGTEKAFDSVDHTFLVAVLKKFGFGDDFIRWVRIILNKQESCIMNNGHSTGYFPLSSVTRQGDPISAYLFILVMEIFLYKSVLTQTLKVLHYLGMNSN